MENQASYTRRSWFLLQCSLSLCQVLSCMLFFVFSGLRWESSGRCCLMERRKRTGSAWRTTSDHHSHWKAGQCGPLLSSLLTKTTPPTVINYTSRHCSRITSEVEVWIYGLGYVRSCHFLSDAERFCPMTSNSLTLTLSSLNPRLYIFRSLLIHLDQACACRFLLQEIFVLPKGPSWWCLISRLSSAFSLL